MFYAVKGLHGLQFWNKKLLHVVAPYLWAFFGIHEAWHKNVLFAIPILVSWYNMADIVGVLLKREGAGSGADLHRDQSTSFFSSALD